MTIPLQTAHVYKEQASDHPSNIYYMFITILIVLAIVHTFMYIKMYKLEYRLKYQGIAPYKDGQ